MRKLNTVVEKTMTNYLEDFEEEANEEELEMYTREEIDEIIGKNIEQILCYIKNKEREYSHYGHLNRYEEFYILYDLNSEDIYTAIRGQGINAELYQGIHEGSIIKIYEFESGRLGDIAEECEGVETEDEIEKYIEYYLDNTVDICVDYPQDKEES